MKKAISFLLLISVLSGSTCIAQSYKDKVTDYIKKYHHIALENKSRYHIPASITLAQGILESNAGYGILADSANNHFGIKCKDQWLGMVYYKEDDDLDTLGNLILSCFRKYDSPEESFADHSLFLSSNPRYARLFTYPDTDYVSWATGLKECGYATAPHYAKTLIDLIERFNLNIFDKIDATVAENPFELYLTYKFIKTQAGKPEQNSVTLPDYYQGTYGLHEDGLSLIQQN